MPKDSATKESAVELYKNPDTNEYELLPNGMETLRGIEERYQEKLVLSKKNFAWKNLIKSLSE